MRIRRLMLAAGIVAGSALVFGALALAAAPFKADTAHSSVLFRVKHMNTSFAYGRFNDIQGTFALDEQDPTASVFDFQVKTASIDTAQPKRDQHLKSPDFFNAVQYPTISFKSKSVSKAGTDAYQVSGDLTLHGVTKPLTFKVTKTGAGKGPRGNAIAGFETSFAIKRSDFGMNKMVGPVGDDVFVIVSVEGMQ